jgi:hypothetical protein
VARETDAERAARQAGQPWRTGPGTVRHPGPPPEVVAERLATMHRRGAVSRLERARAHREWLEATAGMGLDELKRTAPMRLWTVALLHLGGYDAPAIARTLGYATAAGALRALKHPAVQRLIHVVRDAQVERVVRGEYGVTAQAQAAAPAVMEHVTELAGAQKQADGTRKGRAKRDADALRAAELTLTVSGHKVERQAHLHLHVLEEMSEAELEALATGGTWPERYRGVAGLVTGPTQED